MNICLKPLTLNFALLVIFTIGAETLGAENTLSTERKKNETNALATEKISTARSDFFEISAESIEEASTAIKLARELENYFIKNPRLWKKNLPAKGMRVRIELLREAGVFILSRNENGTFTLFLSGNFSGENEILKIRRCFANALLAQMFFQEKTNEEIHVPAWIVSAIATESQLGSVPGRHLFLQKKSMQIPAISPLELISAKADEFETNEVFQLNAVWFLRAVKTPEPFFKTQTPDEKKIEEAFPKFFKKEPPEAQIIELFWTTHLKKIVADAPAGIDLLNESRRAFDNALLFLVEKDGNETYILGGDLVAFRLQQEIREYVAARFATFAEHFRKVNPVWHNAFTEYGVFLEMFSNPDVSAETLSAQWNKALLARKNALQLQSEIWQALDNAEKEELSPATPFNSTTE